jgi:hypothetical protein
MKLKFKNTNEENNNKSKNGQLSYSWAAKKESQ